MVISDKDYRCEDCERFDETKVPADCQSGHGKIFFRHRACADLVLKTQPMITSETERSE